MKLVFTVFRVLFLFVVFFLLGIFLAALVLHSWAVSGQILAAIGFAVTFTWWLEYKRRKRLGSLADQSRRKRKAKLTRKSSDKISVSSCHALPNEKQSTSLLESQNGERHFIIDHRIEDDTDVRRDTADAITSLTSTTDREPSRETSFRTKQPSGWITATETATLAGRDIGGLLYVGSPPRLDNEGYRDTCRAYIDPSLPVAKVGTDLAGDNMSYWPSYSGMSPQCRATYLDWLAGGRSDVAYSPGYMFLFFYGLERRFFIDQPNTDANEIIDEVIRLRTLYPENRSVQRYLGDFLDVATISERSFANISPSFDPQGWDVPFSIKYVIGGKLSRNENLDADWLLAWFVSHPERSLRTPADRCRDEFYALFKIKFDTRFQNGLKVNKPRKQLKAEYRAASGEFQVAVDSTVDGKSVPDISGLRKPIEIAQEVADEAMNDLDKLSRYLGRNKEGNGSLEAHALLPQELWDRFPSESFKQLEVWAHSIVAAGGQVPVLDVVERLEGSRPSKLTKRNLTGVADALARIGFGLAPDPRFALRSPKLEEPVMLFELGESVAELEDVSIQYRVALIETAVSSFVVHADGNVNAKEQTALLEKVRSVKGLTSQEQRRLEANLNWMLIVSPDLPLLRRKLKESDPETTSSIRSALVSAAHADGVVQPEEVMGIEKIYKALGLDPALVFSDLHAGDVQGGPVQVRAAESGAVGEAIPLDTSHGIPKLDASRIAAIRSDTERVSSVLGEIFSETPDNDAEELAQPSLLDGLDEKHTRLVQCLLAKEAWTEDEVQELCNELGLMVSGAIETINEWSFEVYNEGLIDEYEGFEVVADSAKLIKKKLQRSI